MISSIPYWMAAGFWGFVAGSALLLGAALGFFASVPQQLIALVMAFGSGVLISALSFDLMDEAYRRGGFDSAALGFIAGAALYTVANWYLARRGANTASAQEISSPRNLSRAAAGWRSRSELCWTASLSRSSLG